MSPKIDSHIPLPKLRAQWKATLRKLKVGQSFFDERDPVEVRNGLNNYAKRIGIVVTVRQATAKDGSEGTRVWRVS